MKKTFLFASVFVLTVLTAVLLFVLPASADDVVHSGKWGNLDWSLNETTGEFVISGEGEMDAFAFDSTDAWLAYKTSIKSVTLENGITTVGAGAFSGCTELTSVSIPNSVTAIGKRAFYNCKSLESIIIPDSVTGLGEEAFRQCTKLKELTMGNALKRIGRNTFCQCSSLRNIVVPDTVISIGHGAFALCYPVSMTLPFVGCTPDASNSYHFGAIFGADDCYENKKFVPATLRTVVITGGPCVGDGAFIHCEYIQSISLPGSAETIGNEAFIGCINLKSVTIEKGTTRIGSDAFADCVNLKSITIPDTVFTRFSYRVFDNCPNLEYTEYNGAYYLGNSENPHVILVKLKETDISEFHILPRTTVIYDGVFKNCPSDMRIYYDGTASEWEKVVVCPSNNNLIPKSVHIHNWDEGTITVEPTVDAEGVKTFTCECGETKTEVIAKLPAPNPDNATTDGGCGSVVSGGIGLMALITLAGGMIATKKKK